MSENNKTTTIKQETAHIVAFLDLLGASEKIMGNESQLVLNIISNLFVQGGSNWPQLKNAPSEVKVIKYVTFSDNIAFALELPNAPAPSDQTQTVIQSFIKYISVFQGAALKSNFLFRGGIALGPLYMNSEENFVWGKALVEAHNLEENSAIYPRIVLSRQLESFDLSRMPKVRQDFDGMYFVDYLPTIQKVHPDWVEKVKKLIQNQSSKTDRERILQKYAWLQHYIEQCE